MPKRKKTSEKMLCPSCEREFDQGIHFCPHDGTKLIIRSDDELAGETLDGRYRILHKLGEGGMGKVYKAEQITTGKIVAIKIVAKHLSGDEATVRRFRREVNIQSKLEHPNIVTVIDFAQLSSGEYFFVMAFVKGASLQNILLEEGGLELKEFFEFAIQICDGIEYAHRLGIVHRDLKGDNIIIAPLGHQKVVKILDFGIAKALQSEGGGESAVTTSTQLTAQGRILGTPAYMAPEQAKGEINRIGPSTDVYSIGVILYQMITGRLPYESDTPWGVMHKHITEPVPHIPTGTEAEKEIDLILSKCLAKEPEDRFQSALELKEVLEELREDYAMVARAKNNNATRKSRMERLATPSPDELDKTVQDKTVQDKTVQDKTVQDKKYQGGAVQHDTEMATASGLTGGYDGDFPGQEKGKTTVAERKAPPPPYGEEKSKAPLYIGAVFVLLLAAGLVNKFVLSEKTPEPPVQVAGDVAGPAEEEESPAATEEPRELSPEEQKAAMISQTLEEARLRLRSGAYTKPEGQSALDSYRQVLEIDPENKEARQGLAGLGTKLVSLALENMEQRNLGLANDYLSQAEALAPDTKGIKEARKKLNEQMALQEKALAALQKEQAKQKKVDDLLAKANQFLKKGALAEPKGKNATEAFFQVLKVAPGHPEAYKGLEEVSSKALDIADKAIGKKDYRDAEKHISIAQKATPGSVAAMKMDQRLRDTIAAERKAEEAAKKADQAATAKKKDEEDRKAREAQAAKLKAEQKAKAQEAEEAKLKAEQAAMAKKKAAPEAKAKKEAEAKQAAAPEEEKPASKPAAKAPAGMVAVGGGCFQMGDLFKEGEPEERPAHKVCLGDYFIDAQEVTQQDYLNAVGKNPSEFSKCSNCPVENVTWSEALKFCEIMGKRLPTEAEWEYAARERGKKVRFGTGKDIITGAEANFNAGSKVQAYSKEGPYNKKTTPVKSYPPNSLGLYDMTGNVWEWVGDWYDRKYYSNKVVDNPQGPAGNRNNIKVLRGGAWYSTAGAVRASVRERYDASRRNEQIGFRCAK